MAQKTPRCVAVHDDGTRRPEPGTIRDPERGGRVCGRHDPARWDRSCWTDEDELIIEAPEEEA
jgi:hypothetical protein